MSARCHLHPDCPAHNLDTMKKLLHNQPDTSLAEIIGEAAEIIGQRKAATQRMEQQQ